MIIKLWNIILMLLLLVFTACIDEYWPKLDKYENLLVVDGMITNTPGPYIVKLSISSSVDNPRYIPFGAATIIIRDQSGNAEILSETEEGTYTTSPIGIQGIVGRKYRVEITTSDSNNYLSPFVEMKTPVGLDSVYALTEYRPSQELPHDLAGYQFYLDTKTSEIDTNYFLWDLWATYKYKADFKIRFIFEGTLEPFPKSDSLQTCWRTYKVKEIFTSKTGSLINPVITGFPLHFVTTETRELSIRYSLLVKQYTLGSGDYQFWNSVRKQNEDQGGLYTNQPYQIRGNVFNPDDPDEPVLGNFTVASISEQRIFVDRPWLLPMYYPVCELTEGDIENFGTIFLFPPRSWPVYATTTIGGTPALPNQECMDCRLSSGTIEKPEFWIDF
ncbi:MAG: DUF4249 domain-containing protein [Bacteroidales bacterium]|nr:DUF4249 domain-containing protein [Bacteroidales bacterium]